MSSAETESRTDGPRRRVMMVVAAGVIAVVAGGAYILGGPGEQPGEPLALTADGADAMAMCLVFEVDTLAQMSPAFAGTVVDLTESVATLEVDRWYTGGDADVVEIEYTPGFEALIGTPSLETGQRYLITATDGVVNGCGYSGVATPEYEASFDEAFGT